MLGGRERYAEIVERVEHELFFVGKELVEIGRLRRSRKMGRYRGGGDQGRYWPR